MMHKFKSVVMIALAIFAVPLFGGVYVKFDPQGGTFAVLGVTMNSGSMPDEVMTEKGYADPVRIGYNFAGWSSIANPKDDTELDQGFAGYYAAPVTKATTFYAIWEPCAPYCYDNYGCWWREGDILCGQLTNASSPTRCSLEVPGRGWITFKWRMVDAANPEIVIPAYGNESSWQEYVRFDDGHYGYKTIRGYRCYEETYGQGDWQVVRITIADGEPSNFCWQLLRHYDVNAIVQIADITWEPASTFDTTITLEPCGGTLPADNVIVRNGQYGELPTPIREGCEFLGWTEEPPYEAGYIYGAITSTTWLPLSSNVTIYAVWNEPKEVAADPEATIDGGIEFAEGYWQIFNRWKYVKDYDDQGQRIGLRQVWGGEYLCWSRDVTISRSWFDKFDFRSDEDIPILSANVTGWGIYHFQRLYCGNSDLLMRVLVDGQVRYEVPQYSSNPADIKILNGGEHVVEVVLRLREWRDQNYDSETGSYYMRAYGSADVGAMSWWQAPAQIDVNFDARGGQLDGPAVRSYETGVPYGTLPKASRDKFEFIGWFTEPDGGDCVRAGELVRLTATNLHARWSTDLKTAIGGGKLRFATRDDWIGSTDYYHGDKGVSAGTSELVWGETNVMTTVVQGRGILSFWWMQGEDVSVMGDAALTLWLDGQLMAAIKGTAEWQHMTFPVLGEGNHIVEWKYTPGTWVSSRWGQTIEWNDPVGMWQETLANWKSYQVRYPEWAGERPCRPGAWVDEVGWTPGGEVKNIITWAKGVAEGRAWLTDELPLIEAEYTKRIVSYPENYEWLILRAFTKLCRLGENENLKAVLARFGFTPDYQVLGRFFGELDYYDAPLSNEVVDSLAAEAVPTIESALDDLELIPSDWNGSITLYPWVYPVDSVTYVDLADVTLCKAALKGALSALAIAESYDLSVDYLNGEMEAILADAGLKPTFEDVVMDHPDFAKRVRDAERLGEGKEILRDALETLQEFDELMLARSTTEMHFFEYNAKDADKQQYAREEVAKMLASLDGEVEINNNDFRYARDFRIENLKQPATLAPFFAGVLTRRYLPTEINGNIPVFDSFPSMAFGGMFPGLTKDIVAGWLAAYGYEVEYTPNSDYEPKVKYRTFSAAIPKLGASATEAEIKDALAGTADAKIRENVTDPASYAAFETWATKVRSSGVSLKAVKASPCSWQSFALAAPELIQDEITTDDLKVEEFKSSSESGKFDFTVSVKGVTVGSEAMEENLKQMIGLEGSDSLDAVFKSENVDIKFGQPVNGKLKFTAEPKDKEAKAFFMKMKVK